MHVNLALVSVCRSQLNMTALRKKDIFQDVKTSLKSHYMLAYDTWIMGCIEHFIQADCSVAQIKENAYQQWLLHNLKDICPGSLPANISTSGKVMLNGQFVLQINSVLDISVPAYQQYLKLKKTDIENIKATMNPEEKISNKRMLKFELTDGKQDISGIEYETLRKIKTEDILPGSKILIKGPVCCRQGILLLTDSNVEILGGEYEDIREQYSLAAQLANKLNLPIIDTEAVQAEHFANGVLPNIPSSVVRNGTSQNYDPPSVAQRAYQNDVTDRISRQTSTHSNPTTSSSRPTTSHVPHGPSKRSLETEVGTEKKMKIDEDILDDADLNLFEEEALLAMEECEQMLVSSGPVVTSPEPFVYIKQINELSESEKHMKAFRVKAQIQNVLTKLTMAANRQWNLKCTIIDGTGCMDVEFSSDILSKFLGYTPEDISELKKKVATNPEIKSEINAAYVKTAETLRTLYCIMELTMYTLPKITSLIDFEDYHADLLKNRLNNDEIVIKLQGNRSLGSGTCREQSLR